MASGVAARLGIIHACAMWLATGMALAPAPLRAQAKSRIKSLWTADLGKAVKLFEAALAEDPSDAEAATNLGVALSRLGRREEAKAAFRRAVALAPDRFAAYAGLADLYAADEHRWEVGDSAVRLLEVALERVGGDPVGRFALTLSAANVERSIGRTAAARRRLEALDAGRLSPEQRQRVLDLLESIRVDEQARALIDWPEPAVPRAAATELSAAEELLLRGEPRPAAEQAAKLSTLYPGWRAPRWLRARALEQLGRYDDAERQLTLLLQLSPSYAPAWRRLGLLLATHGGVLDSERADEALRQGLALEPGWWDLWLHHARVALRRGRPEESRRSLDRYLTAAGCDPAATGRGGSGCPDPGSAEAVARMREALAAEVAEGSPRPARHAAAPPSPRARELLREARSWLEVGDPAGLAPDLIASALSDSPGFVDAAVTSYALHRSVPKATVEALWDDGEGLVELLRKLRPIASEPRAGETPPPIHEWLDRAVELGVPEARFERALRESERGFPAEAMDDLLGYITSEPLPPHLEEARLLLATGGKAPVDRAWTLARVQLLWDHPAEAAEALGGRCDEKTPAHRLVPLGITREWAGDLEGAVGCYRQAVARPATAEGMLPSLGDPLRRLSEVAARAPLPLAAGLEAELALASTRGVAVADFARSRLLLSRGDLEQAGLLLDRFLREAALDDPHLPSARRSREGLLGAEARAARVKGRRRIALAGSAALVALMAFFGLFRGVPLARGLSRRPALFPEVARAVGEIRHDVIKHRISVLGLLAGGATAREEVARVLWEPERASATVARTYHGLRAAARGRGVTLRRLGREPTFGPMVRDLRRAESLVRRPDAAAATIEALDRRLREVHAERLAGLLRLGPRTRLDAATLSGWIREAQAELGLRGVPWRPPVLHLDRLDLDFPVERDALASIFGNLLRNAEAAIASEAKEGGEPGSVIVRAGEERDDAGRRLLVLQVGDSAGAALTLAAIEGRESGRGLAIVRDAVHEWRGHLAVRGDVAPFTKAVAACFPA